MTGRDDFINWMQLLVDKGWIPQSRVDHIKWYYNTYLQTKEKPGG